MSDADAATPFIIQLQKTLPFALFGFTTETDNLVARSRLLWLRRGGDRSTLWRSVERILLGNFVMVGILLLLLALLPWFLSTPAIARDSGSMELAYVAFPAAVYATLAARAKGWGFAARLGVTIVTVAVCAIAAAYSSDQAETFFADTSMPFLLKAIALPLALLPALGVILLSRAFAKHSFLHIDWRVVQPLGASLRREQA
jgi:hypothetical protein